MKWGLILQYSEQMPNDFQALRTPVKAKGLNCLEKFSVPKEESHQSEDRHVLTVGAFVIK